MTVAECECVPLTPVTVTVNEPVAEPVQDRVEVALVVVVVNDMLVGDSVQVRPVDGETVSERVTLPVNPFTAETVIVEVPGEPWRTETVVGLATTVKSAGAVTVYVTVAVCEVLPLAPVTVTVKLPVVDPVHDRVEVPEVTVLLKVMLVGVSEHVMPVDGAIVSDRDTVPAKPLRAETVIVEVPGEP